MTTTTHTNRLGRLAVAAAALAVGLAPAAQAADSYGAIAYSADGTKWGRSHSYPTSAAAEATAIKSCAADCKVVITFTQCGAVAAKGTERQGGSGATLSAAMDDAKKKLSGGYIDTWSCN